MKEDNKKNIYRSIKEDSLGTSQMIGGLNKHLNSGYYLVEISHNESEEAGLPEDACGKEHYINAHLFVTEKGTAKQEDRVVGQTLVMPQCEDGKIAIYSRSYSMTRGVYEWGPWSKAQQNVPVGCVNSLDSLVGCGMYSGVYAVSGKSPETFLLWVIENDLAITVSGKVRCISQFKYALNTDSSFSYKTRTGRGDSVIEWGNWVDLGAADTTDIQDGAITLQKLSVDTKENLNKVSSIDKIVSHLYKEQSNTKTDITLVDNPARLEAKEQKSTGFGGYRYDISNAYAEGCRSIRFRGANYTLINDIVRGLIVDINGNVESIITTITEKSNGWEELPITPYSSYLWASYVKAEPTLYGEMFTPEYVELVKVKGNVADNACKIQQLNDRLNMMSYTKRPFNLLNTTDLLYGKSLSMGNLVDQMNGVFSNKIVFEVGKTYTLKDIPLFSNISLDNDAARVFVAKFDADDNYLGRDVAELKEVVDGYAIAAYEPTEDSVVYYRVLLQSGNVNAQPFDAERAIIYEGDFVIDGFIQYGDIPVFTYDRVQDARISTLESKIPKEEDEPTIEQPAKSGGFLLTGASFAYNGNAWFAKVCEKLNKNAYNKAVSGESIKNTAIKMHNGTFYSKAEFEDFDTLLIMHVHNQNVCDETDLQDNYTDYEVSTSMSYSQAYDYVLKKYATECYAAKDDSTSKWYGTQCGKPCKVVCMTHWHDARTVFNESIRRLRDKWGFGLIELDKNIGFSKNQAHPVTGAQVSVIYAQDTEVIDGVAYGWHPSRNTGAYIQDRIAEVVMQSLR